MLKIISRIFVSLCKKRRVQHAQKHARKNTSTPASKILYRREGESSFYKKEISTQPSHLSRKFKKKLRQNESPPLVYQAQVTRDPRRNP